MRLRRIPLRLELLVVVVLRPLLLHAWPLAMLLGASRLSTPLGLLQRLLPHVSAETLEFHVFSVFGRLR